MAHIPVLGLEEIAFEVQDLKKSIAFDRDARGPAQPLTRGPQQAWFRVGEQTLALFTRDRVGSGQHFAFLIPPETAEHARA